MSSRIEQIISEIEEYIDSCKTQPLSKTKIIVDKEELDDLLAELRQKMPEEIRRYQKIINNRDEILSDAQAKADAIIAQAQIKENELVSEHQIMQEAYAQANEVISIATNDAQKILDDATEEANAVRAAAMDYTDGLLANVESIVVQALNSSRTRYDSIISNLQSGSEGLISSLQSSYDVIRANRAEMNPAEAGTDGTAASKDEFELDMIVGSNAPEQI